MLLIPAILTKDATELDDLLRQVRDAKKFTRVQIDFVDGLYNNNLTIKPSEVDLIPYFPLKFDAHLMVVEDNVLMWAKIAEKMGFDRVITQVESISEPRDYKGLALDVHSPVEAVTPYLENLWVVVVMAIEPGFGGQEFAEAAVEHVRELARIRADKNYKFRICVDGGVEQKHLQMLETAGADEVAVGAKRVLQWVNA